MMGTIEAQGHQALSRDTVGWRVDVLYDELPLLHNVSATILVQYLLEADSESRSSMASKRLGVVRLTNTHIVIQGFHQQVY